MYPLISQWELARKNPIFCVLLYIIVVLNIGAFCGNEDIYDMWKLLYYKRFQVGVFFEKSFRVLKIMLRVLLYTLSIPLV